MSIANDHNVNRTAAVQTELQHNLAELNGDSVTADGMETLLDSTLQKTDAEATDTEAPLITDEMRQRMESLIEAAEQAAGLAEDLAGRIVLLQARAEVVRKSSIYQLLEQLKLQHDGLSAALGASVNQGKEVADAFMAAAESTKAEFEQGAEIAQAELQQYETAGIANIQRLAQTIQHDVQTGVQELVSESEAKMNAWIDKTTHAWTQAADQVNQHVSDVISRADEAIHSKQAEAMQSAQETVSRCVQLKDEVQKVARDLGSFIAVFSSAMGSTRTGLNVTAGTLNDVVSVFREVV